MNKKIRYLLIFFSFLFFAILAPVIILYVRGISYDFNSEHFVKTGIISFKSDPTDAELLLDNKLKRQGSGDVKFLLPGEYQTEIQKTGYQTWQKSIEVFAGQASWLNAAGSDIVLFFNAIRPLDLAINVLDVYSKAGKIFYLTKDSLIITSVTSFDQKQSYPLPAAVNSFVAEDQQGKNLVIEAVNISSPPTTLVFNGDSGTFSDITGLFPVAPQFQFADDGSLYALNNNILYQVSPADKTKILIASGVEAFYWQGGKLYFVQQQGQNSSLLVTQAPFKNSQTLLTDLPKFQNGQLFVTFEKKIFLLADGSLYLANSTNDQLADNISLSNFDQQSSNLSVLHGGELDYYDPANNDLNFVTRINQTLKNPIIKNNIGYAFFGSNNDIIAIELSTQGSQNQYTLYHGNNLQKFFIDDAGKNILLLDNGELKSLTIR